MHACRADVSHQYYINNLQCEYCVTMPDATLLFDLVVTSPLWIIEYLNVPVLIPVIMEAIVKLNLIFACWI